MAVMAKTLIALAMQLSEAPDAFYESQYSEEARSIVEAGETAPPAETISALEALAEAGDVSALEVLGELHQFGFGPIERNVETACDYFEQVGDRRADSLHNLASCYWTGQGRPQDYPKARELYVKAAEAGWRMSFCAYGKMLILGQGGPVDAKQGIKLCRMTALRGDKHAQTDYGTFLLTGQGVERDPFTARFMLEQAAAQQQANAAFLLAQIHIKGDGVVQSDDKAQEWFEAAYQWGRADAAMEIATILARRGFKMEGDEMFVQKDVLSDAARWFKIASEVDPDAGTREKATELLAGTQKLISAAE